MRKHLERVRAPVYMFLSETQQETSRAQVIARHAEQRAELAAAAAAAESVYPAVDQAAAADDLARLTAMNLQLAQIQSVHDARAAYAARRSEAARSEAAVAADARHVESMQQARMHRIDMNRRRAAAVAAEVVAAGAEAIDAADEDAQQLLKLLQWRSTSSPGD